MANAADEPPDVAGYDSTGVRSPGGSIRLVRRGGGADRSNRTAPLPMGATRVACCRRRSMHGVPCRVAPLRRAMLGSSAAFAGSILLSSLPANGETERCGRPSASELAIEGVRPHSLQ